MNKKGFTLIEILAAVAIIAIIGTIGVVAVTKYVGKTNKEVYNNYLENIKVAADEYMLYNSSIIGEDNTTILKIDDLVKENYIDSLVDPNQKDKKCSGTIKVTKKDMETSEEETKYNEDGDIISSNTTNLSFEYKICLICPSGYKSSEC